MVLQNTSWSEIQAWCTCRMKWHWLYEVRVVPKRVERAPSSGSCGHVAIAALSRGKDWQQAIDEWLDKELNKGDLYDEEIAERTEIAKLILGVIKRYLEKYQDSFKPMYVEHKFEIPIRGLKIMLTGYWDLIVKDATNNLWLVEHKFPQTTFRTEENLELDGQIGVYQYAAHRLGIPVVGTIYNQLLARLPAVPSINKNGSVSRSKVYTDWETYKNTVLKQGLSPIDYQEEMQEKLAGFNFFQRNYVYRNLKEIRLFSRDMERRIWDMRGAKKHIYRCESTIVCGMCGYRELCIESLKGGDIDTIIEQQFEPKKSRKEIEHEQRTTESETSKPKAKSICDP